LGCKEIGFRKSEFVGKNSISLNKRQFSDTEKNSPFTGLLPGMSVNTTIKWFANWNVGE